jgi:Flp pilus assembly pilin Flp
MKIIDRPLLRALCILHSLRGGEAGQGLAEYAMILGLVTVLCVAALSGIKTPIIGSLNNMASAL